jgi:hypothetical protein
MEQEDGDDRDPAETIEIGPDLARRCRRDRGVRARAGKDRQEEGRGTTLDVHLSPPLLCGLEPHV